MTSGEEERLQALNRAIEAVNHWESLTGAPLGAWRTQPDSELARDDAVTHPLNVSPAAWAAITAAVSHLACLRDSLFKHESPSHVLARIHTHGQLTLVRGALENGSMAIWLLEPDRAEERALRRLQQDWQEVQQLEAVRRLLESPSAKTMDERRADRSAIAVRAGVDPMKIGRQPGYEEIVRKAGGCTPVSGKTAVVIWKACSAIAHGELRGLIAYLSNEPLGEIAPGIQLNRVTGNIDLLVTGGLAAIATTKVALGLYAKRAGVMESA
jgi:hypothetical protein